MKLKYWIMVVVLLSFGIAYASENLALLEKGGRMEFTGRPYREEVRHYAFDGDRTTQFTYDVQRVAANKDVPVDRIWDQKVKIERIELRTTGSGRAYEYKFLYWDLKDQDWKEIVHKTENQETSIRHDLKTPVITNKIRYICSKAGPDGNANWHNIYELYYYGEVLPSVPVGAPENVRAAVNETGYVLLEWEQPKPNQDGELPVSYNIYRGNEKGFQISEENLIAEGITSTRWFDISASSAESYYYIVQSIGEFGEGNLSEIVGID